MYYFGAESLPCFPAPSFGYDSSSTNNYKCKLRGDIFKLFWTKVSAKQPNEGLPQEDALFGSLAVTRPTDRGYLALLLRRRRLDPCNATPCPERLPGEPHLCSRVCVCVSMRASHWYTRLLLSNSWPGMDSLTSCPNLTFHASAYVTNALAHFSENGITIFQPMWGSALSPRAVFVTVDI